MEEYFLKLTGPVKTVSAAEEDAATGGPDPKRGIYPNIVTVTGDGYREITDEEIAPIVVEVLEGRP